MRGVLNFLWFVLGGVLMGLAWWLAGIVAYITIVGICFVMGQFSFFPFGKESISRRELHQADDIGTGALGTIGNVIWFIFAGLWLALAEALSKMSPRLLGKSSPVDKIDVREGMDLELTLLTSLAPSCDLQPDALLCQSSLRTDRQFRRLQIVRTPHIGINLYIKAFVIVQPLKLCRS